MTGRKLQGVIPALITPMKEDGSVDYDSFEKHVDFLSRAGVHGFFVNGTTSEAPVLTRSERRECLKIAIAASEGRQTICAAAIAPGTEQVIEEIREIESLGPDYVVSVPPFYFPVSQEIIIQHYEKIARSTEIPVIFYDIPQHTHNKIALATRRTLAESGFGVGFKDSTGDFEIFSQSVLTETSREFAWIQGDDLLNLWSIQTGAAAVVSGLANITPEPYLDLFELAKEGDQVRMLEVQKRINTLFQVTNAAGGRVISGIKAAVSHLGRCKPWTRFPKFTASDSELAAVSKIVDEIFAHQSE